MKLFRKMRIVYRILVVVTTYALLLTEMIRTPIYRSLHELYPTYKPGFYVDFGPYAYHIVHIKKHAQNNSFTAFKGTKENIVNSTNVWSYKYDTVSMVFRAFYRSRGLDKIDSLINCLTYGTDFAEDDCKSGTISLPKTYRLLDMTLNELANTSNSQVPIDLQHPTLFSARFSARFVDGLRHKLAFQFVDQIQFRTAKASYYENITSSAAFEICGDNGERPLLCDAGKVTDFIISKDPVTQKVGKINLHMQERIRKLREEYPHQKIDVAVFESYTDPREFVGGYASLSDLMFDVSMVMRVQTCEPNCTTVVFDQFVFECTSLQTDVGEWATLISNLRIAGQCYFWVRFLSLCVGCYIASSKLLKSSKRLLRKVLYCIVFQVQNQVIIYGSILPVCLYASAYIIDSCIAHRVARSGLLLLQGDSIEDPVELFVTISVLMRSIWIMALCSHMYVYAQTLGGNSRFERGFMSIRGHVFAVLAFFSTLLGYRHASFRNTEVLSVNDNILSVDTFLFNFHRTSFKSQIYSGVLSEFIWVSLLCFLFALVVLPFQIVVRFIYRLLVPTAPYSTKRRKIGLVFAISDALPSSCGSLWIPSALCCSWIGDLFISDFKEIDNTDTLPVFVVMNIAILTDPIYYLLLRYGFFNSSVCTFCNKKTGSIRRWAVHSEQLEIDVLLKQLNKLDNCRYKFLEQKSASDETWLNWIQCT